MKTFNDKALCALKEFADNDNLICYMDLLDTVMDDYLRQSPEIDEGEEALEVLDKVSSLRRLRTELNNIIKATKNENK